MACEVCDDWRCADCGSRGKGCQRCMDHRCEMCQSGDTGEPEPEPIDVGVIDLAERLMIAAVSAGATLQKGLAADAIAAACEFHYVATVQAPAVVAEAKREVGEDV